jgi:hypothetical protein
MDIVYVYRRPKHGEDELRYSIRSACAHLTFRRLIIVGDRPKFLREGSGAIVIADRHRGRTRYADTAGKLLRAARHPGVGRQLALMNDDFFILRPHRSIPAYSDGTIGELLDRIGGRLGEYWKITAATAARIGRDQPSFEIHAPFVFDRDQLLEVARLYGYPDAGIHLRTVYGYAARINPAPTKDHKAKTLAELTRYAQGSFLSVSDAIAQQPQFKALIERRFPAKSRFEK